MYGQRQRQRLNQNDPSMQNGHPDSASFFIPPQPQPTQQQRNMTQNQQHNPYHPQPQQQQPQQQHDYQHDALNMQQSYSMSRKSEDPYVNYAPQNVAPPSPPMRHHPNANGFLQPNYSQNHIPQQNPPQDQFYANRYQPNAGSPQHSSISSMSRAYSGYDAKSSPPPSTLSVPPVPNPIGDFRLANQDSQSHMQNQSSFYNVSPQQYGQQQQQHSQQHHQQHQHQQHQQQQQQPQQQQQVPSMQGAVPFMLAGMQQMATNPAGMNAALGTQLFQTLAPGAAGYTQQWFGQGQEKVKSFMRMPKYYFAVNHRYVLKKLLLILNPFMNRVWARQRGMDPGQFEGSGSDGATSYLPPREDVNAPDLYIPLMAFCTYILMVGFVSGVRNQFHADVLAKYFSKGLGVLSLEVLVIKLGLYLINARPTPWLDVIAYRGYKFVGVVLTMLMGLTYRHLYYWVMAYSATAMGVFLMRSHRRIILPRDVDMQQAQDLARRNAFLLFLSVLQYPIYYVLVQDVRSH